MVGMFQGKKGRGGSGGGNVAGVGVGRAGVGGVIGPLPMSVGGGSTIGDGTPMVGGEGTAVGAGEIDEGGDGRGGLRRSQDSQPAFNHRCASLIFVDFR